MLTKERMYSWEEAILHSNKTDNFGFVRRTGLAIISEPCGKFMKSIEKDRDTALAFASVEKSLGDYSRLLKELAENIDEAQRRVMIALCTRPDMEEIVAQAESESAAIDLLPSGGAAREAVHPKRTRAKTESPAPPSAPGAFGPGLLAARDLDSV